MVVLMSLSVADTALFIFENMSDESAAPIAPRQAPSTAPDRRDNVDLASLNLFGTVQQQAETQVVDAPETRLNLELQGVFTAAERENSTAIVAERNKAGELYHIGDRLPGNATLTEVFDSYILIKRGNRVEKLMFDDNMLRGQSTGVTQARSNAASNVNTARNVSPDARSRLEAVRSRIAERTAEASDNRTAGGSPSGIRDYVEQYRDQIRNDPSSVLDELGIETVEAGEASGYRVGSDIDNQALLRAGLQQGDVILSVNGNPVGNVVNDRGLVDQALAAGRVRVEIQRGSRRFFLTVPIPQDG